MEEARNRLVCVLTMETLVLLAGCWRTLCETCVVIKIDAVVLPLQTHCDDLFPVQLADILILVPRKTDAVTLAKTATSAGRIVNVLDGSENVWSLYGALRPAMEVLRLWRYRCRGAYWRNVIRSS